MTETTVGAGVSLKFPWGGHRGTSPTDDHWHIPLFPVPASWQLLVSAGEEAASALGWSLQSKILPPPGSDTTNVTLKIKPDLLPAPSGSLLISWSYDLVCLSHAISQAGPYDLSTLWEGERCRRVGLRSWPSNAVLLS